MMTKINVEIIPEEKDEVRFSMDFLDWYFGMPIFKTPNHFQRYYLKLRHVYMRRDFDTHINLCLSGFGIFVINNKGDAYNPLNKIWGPKMFDEITKNSPEFDHWYNFRKGRGEIYIDDNDMNLGLEWQKKDLKKCLIPSHLEIKY